MKKTVFLPLVLSAALLASPQKAQATLPASEIIHGIEMATQLITAAKPLAKMAYKAVKKGGKDFIRFVKNHRGHHKTKRHPSNEENNLILPSAPALVPVSLPVVTQEPEEKFNTAVLTAPQTYGYSHRVVRYEEETRYFGGSF